MSDLTAFLLASLNGAKEPDASEGSSGTTSTPERTRRDQSVSSLKLSASAEKALVLAGITTVQQLMEMSGADLLTISGMDVASAAEIRRHMQKRGIGSKEQEQGVAARTVEAELREQLFSPTPADLTPYRQKRPLADLKLPASYVRALEHYGIRTVDDLCAFSQEDLTRRFFLGSGAARAIHRSVTRLGLRMRAQFVSDHKVVTPVRSSSVTAGESTATTPFRGSGPQGTRQWLEFLFSSLSRVERTVLVALHGLDGKGVRPLGLAAKEADVTHARAEKLASMAKGRLAHPVVRNKLRPLAELYLGVIVSNNRPCSVAELAGPLGYPGPIDKYDSVAFTQFVLPLCPGMKQVENGHWGAENALTGVTVRVDENSHSAPEAGHESTKEHISLAEQPDCSVETHPGPPENIPTVFLARIRRPEARVVALVTVLAAESQCAVDFRQLKEYAGVAGLRLTQMAAVDIELGADGIWIKSDRPGELRLCSSVRLAVAPRDLPGRLTDLEFLRAELARTRVFRKTDGGPSIPQVELVKDVGL